MGEEKNSLNGNYSLLKMYQKQLSSFNVLDEDKERKLFEQYRKGDNTAKETIIISNLRLVYKIARAYCNNDEQLLLDLIQEGNCGLTVAIDKYDVDKNIRFAPFAAKWIKKYIFSFLNNRMTIRIPESIYLKLREIKKFENDYFLINNFLPSDKEIAESLGLKEKELTDILSYNYVFTSLDEPIDESEVTLADMIGENKSELYTNMMIEDLIDSLDNEIDKKIIKMYLGLNCDAKNYSQIGEILCITKQAVGQRYKKALKRIKEKYDK